MKITSNFLKSSDVMTDVQRTDLSKLSCHEYLGDGAVTVLLESEKGEGGTLPSVGRKYLR